MPLLLTGSLVTSLRLGEVGIDVQHRSFGRVWASRTAAPLVCDPWATTARFPLRAPALGCTSGNGHPQTEQHVRVVPAKRALARTRGPVSGTWWRLRCVVVMPGRRCGSPAGVWASGETLIINWGRESMCSASAGLRGSGSSVSPLTRRGSRRGAGDRGSWPDGLSEGRGGRQRRGANPGLRPVPSVSVLPQYAQRASHLATALN
jgi:hypothetical protein